MSKCTSVMVTQRSQHQRNDDDDNNQKNDDRDRVRNHTKYANNLPDPIVTTTETTTKGNRTTTPTGHETIDTNLTTTTTRGRTKDNNNNKTKNPSRRRLVSSQNYSSSRSSTSSMIQTLLRSSSSFQPQTRKNGQWGQVQPQRGSTFQPSSLPPSSNSGRSSREQSSGTTSWDDVKDRNSASIICSDNLKKYGDGKTIPPADHDDYYYYWYRPLGCLSHVQRLTIVAKTNKTRRRCITTTIGTKANQEHQPQQQTWAVPIYHLSDLLQQIRHYYENEKKQRYRNKNRNKYHQQQTLEIDGTLYFNDVHCNDDDTSLNTWIQSVWHPICQCLQDCKATITSVRWLLQVIGVNRLLVPGSCLRQERIITTTFAGTRNEDTTIDRNDIPPFALLLQAIYRTVVHIELIGYSTYRTTTTTSSDYRTIFDMITTSCHHCNSLTMHHCDPIDDDNDTPFILSPVLLQRLRQLSIINTYLPPNVLQHILYELTYHNHFILQLRLDHDMIRIDDSVCYRVIDSRKNPTRDDTMGRNTSRGRCTGSTSHSNKSSTHRRGDRTAPVTSTSPTALVRITNLYRSIPGATVPTMLDAIRTDPMAATTANMSSLSSFQHQVVSYITPNVVDQVDWNIRLNQFRYRCLLRFCCPTKLPGQYSDSNSTNPVMITRHQSNDNKNKNHNNPDNPNVTRSQVHDILNQDSNEYDTTTIRHIIDASCIVLKEWYRS
jgi:hypothetical protein